MTSEARQPPENRVQVARRNPVIILLALLTFITVCSAVSVISGQILLNYLGKKTVLGSQLLQTTVDSARESLSLLNQNFPANCDSENLITLRRFASDRGGIRDIGLYDANDQLFCTAALEKVPSSYKQPAPDYTTDMGYSIWMNGPLALGGNKAHGLITKFGKFHIVNAGSAKEIIARSPWGNLWNSGIDGDYRLVANNIEHSGKVQSYLYTLAKQETYIQGFQWPIRAFVTSKYVEDTTFVIQGVVPLSVLLQKHWYVAVLIILFALLLAALQTAALIRYVQMTESLSWRIPRLLSPDNVICYYQPLIRLSDSAVVGCEVLMRINDGGKLIFPDQCLPVIIEKKLTWKLCLAVLENACQELTKLPLPSPFKVAVNFCAEDLNYSLIHQETQRLYKRYGARGLRLNIEVTEHNTIEDPTTMKELHKLSESPYQLSIDDFGTGYSNLSVLSSLAPDYIKIDKTFVFDMEDGSVRSSLIPEMIAIAKAVKAEVVAEGIENEAQLEKLKNMGVEYGQGYHLGRPMPAQAFAKFMAKHYLQVAEAERLDPEPEPTKLGALDIETKSYPRCGPFPQAKL